MPAAAINPTSSEKDVSREIERPRREELDSSDAGAVAMLADALRAAGYPGGGADQALGRELGVLHRKRDLPLFLRRLKDAPAALKTISRLFAFQDPVSPEEAREALGGLELERAEALGIVRLRENHVEPAIALSVCDGLFIAHDPAISESKRGTQADHVLGISPPTLLLGSLTLRRKAGLALDLGTGCGVQALLMARHSRQVIGTDINSRALSFAKFNALLNGANNVEFRFGSLFEPVPGLRFDLIVTNPPYVISPESNFLFRDGGASADRFCAELVRALPQRLEEGGFACLLANWAHYNTEEHWSAPVRRWLEGGGCDAWILHGKAHEPASYAADWNRHLKRGAYERTLAEWTGYYERLGIRSISSGGLAMRRRAGSKNWVRTDELTEQVVSLSDAIERVFAVEDFLNGTTDAELLEMRLALRSAHRIVQTVAPEQGEYAMQEMRLETTEEPQFRASLDGNTFHLLRRCDGKQTLRETLAEVGELAGTQAEEGMRRGLKIVRGLLAHGVLTRWQEVKT